MIYSFIVIIVNDNPRAERVRIRKKWVKQSFANLFVFVNQPKKAEL